MRKQAAPLIVLLALALLCAAQDRRGLASASLAGKVVTSDHRPVANARVEVRDALTGAMVQSTYTGPAGQFEINNLPAAKYTVVATSGPDQVEDNLDVGQAPTNIVLRLPRSARATADGSSSGSNIVSVQQMKAPNKAQSALKHAYDAMAHNRIEEAWKDVSKALAIYPAYAQALVLRGILKLDQKKAEEARADMEEAVKSDPGYPMAYIALGATCNVLQQFDDALRALDRGVAMAPTSWQAYFELGKAYLGKGDYTASLRQLDKAQQFAPQAYGPLHLVKAHALLGLRNYNEAVSELEAYLSKNPNGADSANARDTLEKVKAFTANSGK